MHSKILILDFGSQVTQLIARRVREAGVYCEIHPFQSADAAFAKLKPKAVILSGGKNARGVWLPLDSADRAPSELVASEYSSTSARE